MKSLCLFSVAAVFVILTGLVRADGPPARDWKKAPAIVEVDTPHDIYAIGDIHGDCERLVAMLLAAKIIPEDPGAPEKVQWKAGKATLVCTGDTIDKWDQSVRVILLLRALAAAAEKAGGRVIVTLGNHEADFLSDPKGKKAAEFVKDLKDRSIDPADVAAGTDALGLGIWMRSLPAGVRVNDWFFSHAGDTGGRTLAKLRSDIEAGIDKDGFKTPVLLGDEGLLEARMHPRPWWQKEGDNAAQAREHLQTVVKNLGVQHFVIGHQPGNIEFADGGKRKKGHLFNHGDGLIFLIDCGMSRGVGDSTGAMLRIQKSDKGSQAELIPATGAPSVIWKGS
jgi:hypothetical protein